MALIKGTNCGFVTVAPTGDPASGNNLVPDDRSTGLKDTAPFLTTGEIIVTEIGWFCENATQESNFEVGIYTHNVGDNNPESLLGGVSRTNAKGTGSGWKVASGLNIPITGETIYWIAFQLDNTATGTSLSFDTEAGEKSDTVASQTTLIDPWGVSSTTDAGFAGIYAVVVETTTTSGPGTKGTRHIATRWPVEEGLIAGTTKQTGRVMNLVPEKSLVPSIETEGL